MNTTVPFLAESHIEHQATRLLQEYTALVDPSFSGPAVPVDEILQVHLGLTLDLDDLSERLQVPDVLGATWVEEKAVFIDQSLDPFENPGKEGRYHFTMAHEIGHWQLHRHHLVPNEGQLSVLAKEKPEPTIICRSSQAKERIEWQADCFASYLLMPKEFVFQMWRNFYGHEAPYQVSQDEEAGFLSNPVVGVFARQFKVSRQAMEIRLKKLGLLQYEGAGTLPVSLGLRAG